MQLVESQYPMCDDMNFVTRNKQTQLVFSYPQYTTDGGTSALWLEMLDVA